MNRILLLVTILSFALMIPEATGLKGQNLEVTNQNKFRQLGQELPTPNVYRNASGAPGHEYYQMQADYDIRVTLDDEIQRIDGEETVTYHNNSPDVLDYLWLQLDQNIRAQGSLKSKINARGMSAKSSFGGMARRFPDFDGGFKILTVTDGSGKKLSYVINETMMRIDLPEGLEPGDKTSFKISWWYNINDRMAIGGRSGYEYFEKDDNYLYSIAQFFPRMAVYSDVDGWQHKQFTGSGEFALTFGDYKVAITVPEDHIVAATGLLQNAKEMLSAEQYERLGKAKKSLDEPVMIITQEEATENEAEKATGKKTWVFEAENVRDFGWASSRKFIWDGMGVLFGDRTVLAQSFYPKEGNPLWGKYSTRVVAHTLNTYSKYTFPYPYPHATSVSAKDMGMEYPMLCFNYGRPEEDGTYSKRIKYGMIGVIIHEVGHNYFPMIINSDERQWAWMDEGLNTFVQYLTEQEWEREYPSRRGPAYKIVDYMKGDKSGITPIMADPGSIYQLGNNAYGKPAAALNILRETVMGRELFDYAFKTYANRWMFKHPSPADFFRTMEDASGMDLDWFWRGWFYSTDHVDISLDNVKWYQVSSEDPEIEKALSKANRDNGAGYISDIRNREEIKQTITESDPEMIDFYNEYDPLDVTILDRTEYSRYLASLDEDDKDMLNSGNEFYEISLSSPGGLVMPIILEFEFENGTKKVERLPAEIWQRNSESIKKVFIFDAPVVSVSLDPFLETADVDRGNNFWPPRPEPTRFELYRSNRKARENDMQKMQRVDKLEQEEKENKDAAPQGDQK